MARGRPSKRASRGATTSGTGRKSTPKQVGDKRVSPETKGVGIVENPKFEFRNRPTLRVNKKISTALD